jgi:hypothetical protein
VLIRNSKITEMSRPAEILYRAFIDELKFAKQQQWTISYYTMTLFGAVFAVAKSASKSPTLYEKAAWMALVGLLWFMAVSLLFDLQRHIRNTRNRQSSMEQTFSPTDRNLVDPPVVRADTSTFTDSLKAFLATYELVVVILIIVLTFAALIVGSAISSL